SISNSSNEFLRRDLALVLGEFAEVAYFPAKLLVLTGRLDFYQMQTRRGETSPEETASACRFLACRGANVNKAHRAAPPALLRETSAEFAVSRRQEDLRDEVGLGSPSRELFQPAPTTKDYYNRAKDETNAPPLTW
ncbi:unnamed protein product, partial [Amoebophrya sp. A120]